VSARLGVPREPDGTSELPPLPTDTPVSFVIPARDAAPLIADCLLRVVAQLAADDELIVACADEATAEAVRDAAAGDVRVRVVANAAATTPAALNRAIEAARHPVIIRVDAQSRIPVDYRARLVTLLTSTGAVNVGGRQVAHGTDGFQAAVALAMNSPFGHGGADYRGAAAVGTVRAVDTVYLGAYRREALVRVGGFDERFTTNQDAELNERLRRAGGTVLLDPMLEVGYLPRTSVRALARQFRAYGRGRRATARRHPGSLRARQLAAPVLVASLAGSVGLVAVGAVLGAMSGSTSGPAGGALDWTLVPFVLTAGGYGSLVLLAALRTASGALHRAPAVALALATMHLAWGYGFLTAGRRRR
jgi:succinoglycan biosynthesis protein ExoA